MSYRASSVIKNIEILKSVDNEEFYRMEEKEVKKHIENAYNELVKLGSRATEELGKLLEYDYTWSCYFALKIMREVKDSQSVSYLVNFLKKESDYDECNEEAMFTLAEIGKPSIPLLMEEIVDEFENGLYNFFMVDALTRIVDPGIYNFMVDTTEDFLKNPEKYEDWFYIDHFTFNFVEQGRKDVLSLLKKLLKSKISNMERREIRDTIRALEDPEGWEKELMEMEKRMEEALAEDEEEMETDKLFKPFEIDREELEKTDIAELVNDDDARVIIHDENSDIYLPLLSAIESAIAGHYRENPSLKDRGVIFALKNIRNKLFRENYKPANDLESKIVLNLKIALFLNDFSKNATVACIKRVLNSVKRHKAVDGRRGYLDFIIDFI